MGRVAELDQVNAFVLRAVNRADSLDALVKTMINYFAEDGLGYCTLALLDETKQVFIPKWSTSLAVRPSYVLRYTKNDHETPNALSYSLMNDQARIFHRLENGPYDIPQVKDTLHIDTMMIVPLIHKGNELGVVICHSETHRNYTDSDLTHFEHLVRGMTPVIAFAYEKDELARKTTIQEVMLDSVKELHSSIDVNVVLQELIEIIQSFFPKLKSEIWMTIDDFSPTLSVKSLNLLNMNDSILAEAYHDGQIKIKKTDLIQDGLKEIEIAAPLTGNQGIYGVFHLVGETRSRFDDCEVKFIKTLAETAGIAFENARLYQQSTNLIKQLRLTHDITQKLNRSLNRREIIDLVASELIHTFATDICVVFEPNEKEQTLEVTATNSEQFIQSSYPINEGFSGHVYKTRETLIISDIDNDERRDLITPYVNCSSMLIAPILIDEKVEAIISVGDYKKNSYTFDHYQLIETIAKHASFALRNAQLHEEVERMATTDQLTELFKRHVLDDKIHQSQQKDAYGSLILIDIDHFKQVNDTYGHQVGDQALKQVSHIIRSNVRNQDLASRWGGEELAIYLPRTPIQIAKQVAERIREKVSEIDSPAITISSGVAQWHQEDEKVSVESLFHRADKALYMAKDSGRNCVICENQLSLNEG